MQTRGARAVTPKPLAVLGATGYTGRLVVDRARELGFPLRLVGRRRDALEEMAVSGDEIRVADARDERALREAFDGVFAVASLAGPFLATGDLPVAAAIDRGAHYLDTSGEQAFARRVYDTYGGPAEAGNVVVLTSFGFDYVPGDFAARLAADGLEPLDEVLVAYSVSSVAASSGTRKTIGHVMRQPQVTWEGGRLVESRFGASMRTMRFPFGDRAVVEWSGTEPLTVPRHTQTQRVRSYVRAPRAAARTARIARLAAPLVGLTGRVGDGPSPQRRARTKFTVVAEAHGPNGSRRVTLTGQDPYGLTALLIAHGAQALRNGEVRNAGTLAPAEAFEPRSFIARVAPLIEIQAVEEL
ncbi:MAG: hypothetical protein E6G64_05130 [Actinobacteria bacterium]|nr:MAG: hypothetical protein E6G64_05130 [Actinomycetota bacterium]